MGYCTVNDIQSIYTNIDSFNEKKSLDGNNFADFVGGVYGAATYSGSLYGSSGSVSVLYGSGNVYRLYKNGRDLGPAKPSEITSVPETWYYDADADALVVNDEGDRVSEWSSVEVAPKTFIMIASESIERGAEMLESLLDNHFPRPLPKSKDLQTGGEYDYPLVRANAILACLEMMMSTAPDDTVFIPAWRNELWNEQKTGIIDRLNSGELKLSFDPTSANEEGDLSEKSVSPDSSGFPQYPEGQSPADVSYDKFTILITEGGTMQTGVENTTIKYKTFDRQGTEVVSEVLVNGFEQSVGAGISVVFSDGIYTTNDAWYLTVRNPEVNNTAIKVQTFSRL